MLAEAHKKFYRIRHPEIFLLDLKVQYKHKIKLPLDMVSKHVHFCAFASQATCLAIVLMLSTGNYFKIASIYWLLNRN